MKLYMFLSVAVLFLILGQMAWAGDVVIKKSDGGEVTFSAEVADTPNLQARGLMKRNSMPLMHGMLFVFDYPTMARFWMKGTLIPLDMIFVSADGTISKIHENAQPMDLTPILATKPTKAVFEINGGQAKKLGILPGDKLFYSLSSNRLEKQ